MPECNTLEVNTVNNCDVLECVTGLSDLIAAEVYSGVEVTSDTEDVFGELFGGCDVLEVLPTKTNQNETSSSLSYGCLCCSAVYTRAKTLRQHLSEVQGKKFDTLREGLTFPSDDSVLTEISNWKRKVRASD